MGILEGRVSLFEGRVGVFERRGHIRGEGAYSREGAYSTGRDLFVEKGLIGKSYFQAYPK